jgi:hypothetical protein
MKKKKLIVITIIIIALILTSLSIFSIRSTSYVGYEAIAERKARETFFFRYFPSTLVPYSVSIDNVSARFPLFQKHQVYMVRGYIMGAIPPLAMCTVAIGQDEKSFLLPDDFRKVVVREHIVVDSKEKALEVVKAYLDSSFPYGDVMIIQSFLDIPKGGGKDPAQLADAIKPLYVIKTNGNYRLELFTWRSMGGVIHKWSFTMDEKGELSVEKVEIDRNVGAVIGLL